MLLVDLALLAGVLLLGLLFVLLLVGTGIGGDLLDGGGEADITVQRVLLWGMLAFNLVTMGIIPFLWVLKTRAGGWEGARRFLGLHRPLVWVPAGVLLAGALVMLLAGVGWVVDQFIEIPEDGLLADPAVFTWPLVVAIALVSGFSEEILFRGVLQKWLRWWGQGLVFGAFHAANAVTPIGIMVAVVVTTGIGLLFGYLRHRGLSMWALISAHAAYNFILIVIAMYASAPGGG